MGKGRGQTQSYFVFLCHFWPKVIPMVITGQPETLAQEES